MAIDSILALIDAEIASLQQARTLLASASKAAAKETGIKIKKAAKAPKKGKKRRVLSAEARKRIADAQRKRWAAQKAKAK
jgi:hypothetical protein